MYDPSTYLNNTDNTTFFSLSFFTFSTVRVTRGKPNRDLSADLHSTCNLSNAVINK